VEIEAADVSAELGLTAAPFVQERPHFTVDSPVGRFESGSNEDTSQVLIQESLILAGGRFGIALGNVPVDAGFPEDRQQLHTDSRLAELVVVLRLQIVIESVDAEDVTLVKHLSIA